MTRPRTSSLSFALALQLGVGAASFVLLSTSAASAAAPLAQSLSEAARADYTAAKLLFDDHDFAGAATKFRAAYDSSHDARLLWNVAACEKELRHYARASALIERFLHDATTLDAAQTEQARATLTAFKELFSQVTLEVQPAGASVRLDGEEIGPSPLTKPVAIDIGTHTLHVQRDGYAPVDQPLSVTGSSSPHVAVSLQAVAAAAFLAVQVDDPAESVRVDGRLVGNGSWEGQLAPGAHQLRVEGPGKEPQTQSMELSLGEHRSVSVTLQAEKHAIWPWLVGGGAVVVAGLSVGGYFLFRPSDSSGAFPDSKLGTVMAARHGGGR